MSAPAIERMILILNGISPLAIGPTAMKIKKSIAPALVDYLSKCDIDHSGALHPLRLAHFLAQAAHETDGFATLEEYASGKAYEGRPDLGNTCIGDGVRYKGRGIFQLTGRANYRNFGGALGIPLEQNPELAMRPDVAVQVACKYWKAKSLNALADQDDLRAITKKINGGYNGLADRSIYLQRAKRALGL